MKDGTRRLVVNGRTVDGDPIPDEERLLDTLRWRLGLKGTKEGCRSGDCGACTVLLDGRSVLSCLMLTGELGGRSVTTLEGISEDREGARVLGALAAEPALQCGYCTPGFVMAITGLLKELGPSTPTDRFAEDLAGNLCRCTGYGSILRAVERLRGPPP